MLRLNLRDVIAGLPEILLLKVMHNEEIIPYMISSKYITSQKLGVMDYEHSFKRKDSGKCELF